MERNYDIFFYDIKTGETLFDYTLEDFIRDNYDETADYDKIYDNVLINVLKDEIPSLNADSDLNGIIDSHVDPVTFDKSTHEEILEGFAENNILEKNTLYQNNNFLPSEESKDNINLDTLEKEKIISTDHSNACILIPKVNEAMKELMIQNRIHYSYNIFYFKNKYNIINLLPLTNVEIELLKKTFLIKKKNIINPVKIYYRNGDVYKGEINKKYQKNGYGITLYNNGDIFSVLWKKNIAIGYGTYQYTDNTQLFGIWDNDIFHGNNNIIYYCNGDVYQGNIEYNIINGYGIMKYSDGRIYEGYWNNNMHCINGLITYPNGERFQYVDPAKFHTIIHPFVAIDSSKNHAMAIDFY
jgi:hypothetical protein